MEGVARKEYRQTAKDITSNYNVSLGAQQGITKGKPDFIIVLFGSGQVLKHQVKHITRDLFTKYFSYINRYCFIFMYRYAPMNIYMCILPRNHKVNLCFCKVIVRLSDNFELIFYHVGMEAMEWKTLFIITG